MNNKIFALTALIVLASACVRSRKCCKPCMPEACAPAVVAGPAEACTTETVVNQAGVVQSVAQPIVEQDEEEIATEPQAPAMEPEQIEDLDTQEAQVPAIDEDETEDLDESLAFNNIQFDYNSKALKKDQYIKLASNAEKVKKASEEGFKLRVEGHASTEGTEEYNMALSDKRAKSVVAYLNNQGVNTSNIEVVAFGSTNPLNLGNKDQQSPNRRVEIVAYKA